MNDRQERKLGRDVLETISEIGTCPRDNVRQFLVLKKRLVRRVKAYQIYTGSEKLLHKADYYGFETRRYGSETN
jgi:hypothetical protein